jgi:hypothetical protein
MASLALQFSAVVLSSQSFRFPLHWRLTSLGTRSVATATATATATARRSCLWRPTSHFRDPYPRTNMYNYTADAYVHTSVGFTHQAGSRGTPNKAAVKKAQGSLKSLVNNFGNLISVRV